MDDAANALGVACLVERKKRREVIARTRIDKLGAREIPPSDAQAKL
jgi:hypothetical protein